MITIEQALVENEFHYGGPADCERIGKTERWRRNGVTKTWKTRPGEFRIPIKHGLYNYGEIINRTASCFHIAKDCTLNFAKKEEAQTCLPF